jgi:hypothetical protein
MTSCGSERTPCCNGTACNARLVCSAGTCVDAPSVDSGERGHTGLDGEGGIEGDDEPRTADAGHVLDATSIDSTTTDGGVVTDSDSAFVVPPLDASSDTEGDSVDEPALTQPDAASFVCTWVGADNLAPCPLGSVGYADVDSGGPEPYLFWFFVSCAPLGEFTLIPPASPGPDCTYEYSTELTTGYSSQWCCLGYETVLDPGTADASIEIVPAQP